jgi:hypothetical protein
VKKDPGLSTDARACAVRLFLCVRNEGYPAALELRKVYRVLVDEPAAKRRLVRVVDESGEDYLYPREWFLAVARGMRFLR